MTRAYALPLILTLLYRDIKPKRGWVIVCVYCYMLCTTMSHVMLIKIMLCYVIIICQIVSASLLARAKCESAKLRYLSMKEEKWHRHRVWNGLPTFEKFLITIFPIKTKDCVHVCDKMAAILQSTFWNAFCGMKIYEFSLRFHCSLFLKTELTIFQYWFR